MQDDANSPKKTQSDSPARRQKSGMKPNQSETTNGRWEEKITNQKKSQQIGTNFNSFRGKPSPPIFLFFSFLLCSISFVNQG
jgi:hypothetical protein